MDWDTRQNKAKIEPFSQFTILITHVLRQIGGMYKGNAKFQPAERLTEFGEPAAFLKERILLPEPTCEALNVPVILTPANDDSRSERQRSPVGNAVGHGTLHCTAG